MDLYDSLFQSKAFFFAAIEFAFFATICRSGSSRSESISSKSQAET